MSTFLFILEMITTVTCLAGLLGFSMCYDCLQNCVTEFYIFSFVILIFSLSILSLELLTFKKEFDRMIEKERKQKHEDL